MGGLTWLPPAPLTGTCWMRGYMVLPDDKKVFREYRAQLLIRQDALTEEPGLRSACSELSGKIGTMTIRKLTAALEAAHGDPRQVAAEFLAQAGLK